MTLVSLWAILILCSWGESLWCVKHYPPAGTMCRGTSSWERAPSTSPVVLKEEKKKSFRSWVLPCWDDFQDTEAAAPAVGSALGCKGRLLSATFQGELIRRVAGGARASQIWLIGCSALCLQPISILQLNSHHPVVLGDPLLPPIPSTFLFGFGVGNFFFFFWSSFQW